MKIDRHSKPTVRKMLLLAFWLMALAVGGAVAQEARLPAQEAAQLNNAIEEVVSRPEYAWRLPRESAPGVAVKQAPFMEKLLAWGRGLADKAIRLLRKIEEWLKRFAAKNEPAERAEINWKSPAQILLFVLLSVVCSVLGVLLYRLWLRRGRIRGAKTATAVNPPPDVADENIQPDILESDEWINLSREFFAKGEFRLAVRAMFLACLVALARRERITIARFKSNREYLAELSRKAKDTPAVLSAFGENIGVLEKTWYGLYPADRETCAMFEENWRKIVDGVKPRRSDDSERRDSNEG